MDGACLVSTSHNPILYESFAILSSDVVLIPVVMSVLTHYHTKVQE